VERFNEQQIDHLDAFLAMRDNDRPTTGRYRKELRVRHVILATTAGAEREGLKRSCLMCLK
jgi:hypothetical protein